MPARRRSGCRGVSVSLASYARENVARNFLSAHYVSGKSNGNSLLFAPCSFGFCVGRRCTYRGHFSRQGDRVNASSTPNSSRDGEGNHHNDNDSVNDAHANNFPASFFLDPQIFKHFNVNIPTSRMLALVDIGDITGNTASVRDMAARFFESVHPWFPILSRNKFYGRLVLQQLGQQEGDSALLVICMTLLMSEPPGPASLAQSSLYIRVKRFLVDIELAGTFTITVLQATVFLALYEIAHGIYPAAYSTVGACARYGFALGLDKEASRWEHDPVRWVESEERHRAWWGVIILDRYVYCPRTKAQRRCFNLYWVPPTDPSLHSNPRST